MSQVRLRVANYVTLFDHKAFGSQKDNRSFVQILEFQLLE